MRERRTAARDTARVATRMTSSRVIGRDAELAELEAALTDASGGRPSLAFVAGESGVGKSRLVAELASRARAAGARVEIGDCVELGTEELPYAPIVAVLRSLARADDPVLDELPRGARSELTALLPELGPAAPEAEPRARGYESSQAQARLFETLLTLIDRLGRDAPLALVLEDIHWADRSTRAFLVFLGRSLWAEGVLVVATYRSDELHRRHPLRPLLAELERVPSARRIELARLTRPELAEQLGDILGAPPDDALAERLFERSEGNPLFTEELLAAGLDGRGALPTTLRDALMVRVERLSEPAQEMLRLLSAGRILDHDVLDAASGLDAARLRGALREAADANILRADERGRYRFRHALLREVVHDDLLPGEHAELHLALARALEQHAPAIGDDAHVRAGIAHHYLSAGCQDLALAAAVRAADAAELVHAPGEAAAQLERALDLWPRVAGAERLAGADHVTLLARAAGALSDEGEYVRAVALLERALGELDADAEPHRATGVLERLSRALWALGRAEEGRAAIARALALLPEDDVSAERARILAWEAKVCMLQGRYRETVAIGRDALEAAARANAAAPRIMALNSLGIALIAGGELDEGVRDLRSALEAATEEYDRASAYVNLADSLHLVGRSEEALAIALEGRERVTLGDHAGDWLRMSVSEIQFDLGDWEAARAAMPPDERHHHGMTFAFRELRRAETRLADGDHDTARQGLERIAELVAGSREPQFIGWCGALRGELERRAGDLAAARAAVDDALDAIEFCSEDLPRVARLSECGAAIEADAAQRARDLGDPEAERLAIARAEAYLARAQACVEDWRPVERARALFAEAEAARARGAADERRYAAATRAYLEARRPYPAALAGLRRAELLAGEGERERAADALADVRATADALGARWLAAEAEGLAARARLPRPGADDGQVGPPRLVSAEEAPFGLTPRERQVLALVAAGATNREIGAQLYMAEKTASVHVSRILAKLDVRSRTEAAAVAHRLGLDA